MATTALGGFVENGNTGKVGGAVEEVAKAAIVPAGAKVDAALIA